MDSRLMMMLGLLGISTFKKRYGQANNQDTLNFECITTFPAARSYGKTPEQIQSGCDAYFYLINLIKRHFSNEHMVSSSEIIEKVDPSHKDIELIKLLAHHFVERHEDDFEDAEFEGDELPTLLDTVFSGREQMVNVEFKSIEVTKESRHIHIKTVGSMPTITALSRYSATYPHAKKMEDAVRGIIQNFIFEVLLSIGITTSFSGTVKYNLSGPLSDYYAGIDLSDGSSIRRF